METTGMSSENASIIILSICVMFVFLAVFSKFDCVCVCFFFLNLHVFY